MVKFLLDPGHDELTPGKGVAGLKEFTFNKAVALKVEALLNEYEDTTVIMSHDLNDKIDQSLASRATVANKNNVDAVVSIHANAASATSARGIETFVHPKAPKADNDLARAVHTSLIQVTQAKDRGLKKADFQILRDVKGGIPVCLVECGFMTNTEDFALLISDDYRNKCAKGIVAGLVKEFNLKKKPAKIINYYTGGYTGEGLSKIQTFIATNKWWYKPTRNSDGSLSFLVGGFAKGSVAAIKLETFLKENNYWYRVE
jgi:N-acetylmuramoyl-L-alanine amidase